MTAATREAAATARPARGTPGWGRSLRVGRYYAVMVFLAVLFVLPLLWTLLSSLKTPAEASKSPPTLVPHSLSTENYRRLATAGVGLGTYLGNSLVVSTLTVVITVVASVLGGYGFARYRFPGRAVAFFTILGILMVPYPSILIALYVLLSKVQLQNSLIGLSLVLVVFQLPFGIYMMRNSVQSFPRELEEAALVDGATTMVVLVRVVLRGVLPGIITVGLFAFLASWNEFLAPLIFLNDGSKFTLPVMLVNIRSGAYGSIDFGALQAGIVVAMVPCVLLFVGLQKFYISGLIAGAVKE